VLAAFALDFLGFLMWSVNTYRVFTCALTWGCLLVAVRKTPLWATFLLMFVVFQYEFGTAALLLAMTVACALLVRGRAGLSTLLAAIAGAGASVAMFAIQVLTHFGWAGLMADLTSTVERRGASVGYPDLFDKLTYVPSEYYGRWVTAILAWGVVTAVPVLLALLRPKILLDTQLGHDAPRREGP
jgi:hypothetical protein